MTEPSHNVIDCNESLLINSPTNHMDENASSCSSSSIDSENTTTKSFRNSTNDLESEIITKSLSETDLHPEFKVKDHGYAWVVVLSMFLSNSLTTGYVKGFGLLFNAIKESYPEITVTMAGVMMSLLTGCKCIFSPLGGFVGNKIGIRLTMFIGSTLCCVALLSAYFCNTAAGFAITLGAMSGVGQCIIEACHVITVSNYFDNKLSMANGIRVAGNSFGGIIYPLMLTFLLRFFGISLLFLMLAAVMTHLYICAALARPIDLHLKICSLSYVKAAFNKSSSDEKSFCEDEKNPSLQLEDIDLKKKLMYQELISSYPNINKNAKKKPLDFSYLVNPVYLLFLAMAAGIPMALPLVTYYMSIYAKNEVGLSLYDISIILSVQSIIDVGMRLLLGYLNSKKYYKLVHGYVFCLFLSACGSFMMPFANGLFSIMVAHFLSSLGANAYHTFVNVILTDQFGKDSIATTYGFARMVQGIFSLIHPTLIGYIVDTTGGFKIPFFVMGSGLVASGLVILVEPLVIKLTHSKVIIT